MSPALNRWDFHYTVNESSVAEFLHSPVIICISVQKICQVSEAFGHICQEKIQKCRDSFRNQRVFRCWLKCTLKFFLIKPSNSIKVSSALCHSFVTDSLQKALLAESVTEILFTALCALHKKPDLAERFLIIPGSTRGQSVAMVKRRQLFTPY